MPKRQVLECVQLAGAVIRCETGQKWEQAPRTPNASRGTLSIESLARFGDQIIIGVADDFHLRELAERQVPAHVYPAVYVRRIGFPTGDQETAFERGRVLVVPANEAVLPGANERALELSRAGRLLDQYLDSAAYELSRHLYCPLVLRCHGQVAAFALEPVRRLSR